MSDFTPVLRTCLDCRGTGDRNRLPCMTCKGSGLVWCDEPTEGFAEHDQNPFADRDHNPDPPR